MEETLLFIFLYFLFLFKLNKEVSLSNLDWEKLSHVNGVYIPTLFPSLTWNKINVGPLLSQQEWKSEKFSPLSDNLYNNFVFMFLSGLIQVFNELIYSILWFIILLLLNL